MNTGEWIEPSSGVTDTPGFLAGACGCDIRGNNNHARLDLALLAATHPCTAAGVFTTNTMAAAPVRLGRNQLATVDQFRAVVVNSGNANACTGEQGMVDAHAMREMAAEALGCRPEQVVVCSTGRIGRALPMAKIAPGIATVANALGDSEAHGLAAADAILTSDTRRKVATFRIQTSSGPVTVAGMAKGAGMIEPNMATMLAFLTTDADVTNGDLRAALQAGVKGTFNALTVDGDMSTNDTVLLLANGVSGIKLSPNEAADWKLFLDAVEQVCHKLAQKIVGDGEKISKVVEIRIEKAATEEEAVRAARAIGNSLLVKTSWYGGDPNWGRVLDAVGYSGAVTSEQQVALYYASEGSDEKTAAFVGGMVHDENLAAWRSIVAERRFRLIVELGSGTASTRLWATDLSEGYVNFNKSE